ICARPRYSTPSSRTRTWPMVFQVSSMLSATVNAPPSSGIGGGGVGLGSRWQAASASATASATAKAPPRGGRRPITATRTRRSVAAERGLQVGHQLGRRFAGGGHAARIDGRDIGAFAGLAHPQQELAALVVQVVGA